jgi:hypothetical protein
MVIMRRRMTNIDMMMLVQQKDLMRVVRQGAILRGYQERHEQL